MLKIDALKDWIEKARAGYHEHDGFPDHPVAVRHHQEYFFGDKAEKPASIQGTIQQNSKLTHALQTLSKRGKPYLVGGSVRDLLLGKEIQDFDIEVYGISSDDLSSILTNELGAKGEQVGKQFGVFKVGDFDISLPRRETKTGDKHTDFNVTPDPHLELQEAAKRRDFTINALMYDPNEDKILDFFGGQDDLNNGIIRHINDETFIEDPLRVYRAAQFAARFGFDIADKTKELAASMDLSSLPPERVNGEFKKLFLKSDTPSIGIQALDDMNVLGRYYPEIAALKHTSQRDDYHAEGNVYIHTKMVIDRAAEVIKRFPDVKDKTIIMFAALAHDFGKPATTKISDQGVPVQPGHEQAGVEPTQEFLDKLTNESDIVDNVLFIVENHLLPLEYHRSGAGDSAFRRAINKFGLKKLELLAAVSEADATGRLHKNSDGHIFQPKGEELDWFRQRIQDVSTSQGITQEGKIVPLMTGDHLKEMGFKEGPKVGQILQDVRSQQEEGSLTSLEDAQKYVADKYLQKSKFVQLQDFIKQEGGAGGFAGTAITSDEAGTTTFGSNGKRKTKYKPIDLMPQGDNLSKAQITIGNKQFSIEMAIDKITGLGHRSNLQKNHGMLFISGNGLPQKFHMEGMQFPLDFVAIGENNTVIQIERNIQPSNRSIFTFPPCNGVLELNAGDAAEIKTGDPVEGINFANAFLQKQMAPEEAKQRGLVPESGNWQRPYRWIKPKGQQRAEQSSQYYHGTPHKQSILEHGFETTRAGATSGYAGTFGVGIYLTNDPKRAELYGETVNIEIPDDLKLFVTDNPIPDLFNKETDYGDPAKITEYIQSQGYDGIQVIGQDDAKEVVIFTPERLQIHKQMAAPYLAGEQSWSHQSYASMPKKTGFESESDYVRELSEEGVLNEEIEAGVSSEERSRKLHEGIDPLYEDEEIEKEDPNIVDRGGCSVCEPHCSCTFNFGCECDHDCICGDLDLAKECNNDGCVIDIEKLLI